MADIERLGSAVYNNLTGNAENIRTANVFKIANVPTGAGSHVLWTPAAGKRFRVLGLDMYVSAQASVAAAADVTFDIRDGGATIIYRPSLFIPTTAVTTAVGVTKLSWFPGANGYLSTTPDNTLQSVFSIALATGTVVASVWGTEE